MIEFDSPAQAFRGKCFLALILGMTACVIPGFAEGPVPAVLVQRAVAAAAQTQGSSAVPDKAKPETHITPEQAQQLFSLVDQILKFSSDETGLPIKSAVKRQMTTRAAVESYLNEKFNEDQDAKRMQRSEIVMKKFGLLDRDF